MTFGLYAYAYPDRLCFTFRRVLPEQGGQVVDNRDSHIPKRVQMYEGEKVIFTNEVDAYAEVIESDIDITTLSSSAGYAIALKLAVLWRHHFASVKVQRNFASRFLQNTDWRKPKHKSRTRTKTFSFVDEDVEIGIRFSARMKYMAVTDLKQPSVAVN
jgi:hypothetical protein